MNKTDPSNCTHTQCPHCNTLFQITEEQLTSLEGKVRCGYCYRTFNARETLINELTEPASATVQVKLAKPDNQALAAISSAKQELQANTRQQLGSAPKPNQKKLPLNTLVWPLGLVLLSLTFIAQYTYFYRGDLAQQHPPLRAWLGTMCDKLGCTMPLIKAPQELQLVGHDMRTHPDQPNALRVRGTFINNADFSQPYPVIRLSLMDLNGQIIAHRDFSANDYLTPPPPPETGIPPAGKIEAELDIMELTPKIMGFSLKAL